MTTTTDQVGVSLKPDWVSPPGDSIEDRLEEFGWTRAELARRLEFTPKHVNELLKGRATITPDTAARLERVLGSTAGFWLRREAAYRLALQEREEIKSLSKHADWLRMLPVAQMVKLGWIKKFTKVGERVREALRFFGVNSVDAWHQRYGDPATALRSSKSHRLSPGSLSAWLRAGELRATSLDCEKFRRPTLEAMLPQLKVLSLDPDPAAFVPKLRTLCAKAGVVVAFVPTPPKCPVSGAIKWISTDRALLILSLRHKRNDHLWFTFFHEIGHILLHGKGITLVDVEQQAGSDQENEADAFARDFLIPPERAPELRTLGRDVDAIRAFAEELGVAPGIIVGRLQKEALLHWSELNQLKVAYSWNCSAQRLD